MIPPRAKMSVSSAITISLEDNSYSLSFNAVNVSPSFAKRITIFPIILSASKQ